MTRAYSHIHSNGSVSQPVGLVASKQNRPTDRPMARRDSTQPNLSRSTPLSLRPDVEDVALALLELLQERLGLILAPAHAPLPVGGIGNGGAGRVRLSASTDVCTTTPARLLTRGRPAAGGGPGARPGPCSRRRRTRTGTPPPAVVGWLV